MAPARLGLCLAAGGALLAAAPAPAVEVARGYLARQWTSADGLPADSVNAVLQSADGYLWLATFDGLVRFDGARFVVFRTSSEEGLPTNRLTALAETADGGLWAVGEQAQLVRFDRRSFTHVTRRHGLPDGHVRVLHRDPDGTLWAGTDRGLARHRSGDRFETVAGEAITERVTCIARDGAGALWVGGHQGLFRLDGGRVERFGARHGLPDARVTSLFPEAPGTLWIGTAGGLALRRGDAIEPVLPGWRQRLFRIARGGAGALWLLSDRGVFRYQDGEIALAERLDGALSGREELVVGGPGGGRWRSTLRHLYRDGGLVLTSDDTINDLTFDREGNLWLGTASTGLFRLRRSPFETWGRPEGLPGENVYPMLDDRRGAIWLGTMEAGALRLDGGGAGGFDRVDGPEGTIVWSLLEDREGTIWLGGEGLCRLAAGACSVEGIDPRLAGQAVRALVEDRRGWIWAGAFDGLYRRTEAGWERLGAEAGLPPEPVRVFLEARDGTLWMGTNGGGLVRFRAGRFERLTRDDGLPSDLVRALYEDASGALWVGTEDRGLGRIEPAPGPDGRPRLAVVRQRDGLADDGIHQVLEDDQGRLWMSTNRGLFWVAREALERFAAGRAERVESTAYDERAGLRHREANGGVGSAGLRARDGRLWFPTRAGAVAVDPRRVPNRPAPPAVLIEEIAVRGAPWAAVAGPVRLAASERDFEVAYTAPSFAEPERVRFRYRLEGFERDWSAKGERRTAVYTHVPAGSYRFRVQARNGAGPWSEPGAALELTVAPFWYERAAVRGAAALAALLLAAGGVHRRTRRHRAREHELERRVAERTEDLGRQTRATEEALAKVAEQAAALREMSEAKQRFFANVSHELRTPLTLLVGPLEDAAETGAALSADQQRLLLRNARRLERLVDQLLDVQKIDAGAFELAPRPGDLALLVRRTVEALLPLAERHGIRLAARGAGGAIPWVFDAEALEKVLGNLLSNAMKATPAGGAVEVSLSVAREAVEIAVADTGAGIPAELHERIFERFFQAGGEPHQRRPGTGIGLALAREIVQLHRGSLTVESEPGRGSRFTVRLPRVAADKAAGQSDGSAVAVAPARKQPEAGEAAPAVAAAASEPTGAGDRVTVLVVEDHPEVRAYVRRILARSYRVLEAADGEEGFDRARAELPDVIVADVMMAPVDGFELGRRLRRDPVTDCIPLIYLTARADDAGKIEGFASGADQYVTKPFAPVELRARIDAILARRRRLRERLRTAAALPAPAPPPMAAIEARARSAILAHLHDDELSVAALAFHLHLSRSQLHRRLRIEAGTTPQALLRKVRLERAAELLREGAGNASEVAAAVGFASLSHFSRSFREEFGMAPTGFREAATSPAPSPSLGLVHG